MPLYLLFAILLGLAQATAALICYKGNHTTVMSDFPLGSNTCLAAIGDYCVEKRRTNWETNPGFFELYFGCGKCGTFDTTAVDCRDCSTDHCNADYGNEFKRSVSKLTLCYNSLNTTIGPLPVPVFCPKDQNCTSSPDPNDAEHFLVGCMQHCDMLNWQNCLDCNTDLCNLDDRSSHAGGLPVALAKVELPTPPPTLSPSTVNSFDTSGDKSEKASTGADVTAESIGLATVFAALAAQAATTRLASWTL